MEEQNNLSTAPADTLARIEELLTAEKENSRKLLRSSRLRNVLMIIFVGVLIVTAIAFYDSLQTITKDIPDLVVSARSLIGNVNGAVDDVIDKVDELNIEALNDSIEGISEINYQGLNTSITGLANAVQGFEDFVDALQRPANAFSSLFGGGRGD
ncbi:MAG: hypothetical protein HDQ87_08010 [Clostridia bacterium]|nr:hypothetical protein [Clostridia bacterium]